VVRRFQIVAAVATALFLALGLAASVQLTPRMHPTALVVAAIACFTCILGGLSGLAVILRKREIEARRWELVQDGALTSGEREVAHRDADQAVRVAGRTFFLAAVSSGGWLSYQFRDPEQFTPSDLLILAPVLGFLIGLALSNHFVPTPRPNSDYSGP
jgi:hypothetical protein